jgi:glycosyltransferase involved in cell wall biosynthesis
MPAAERPHRERPRRLLLISHRPIDYGGGGSVRWRFLSQALPRMGWEVGVVTARPNPTANEASTNPRHARLAELRARIMNAAGDAARPLFHRAGVQPEAFAPNLAWSLTGVRPIRRAIERESPDVVWATGPPQSAIFAGVRLARRARIPVVAELRDLWAGNPFFDADGKLLARLEGRSLGNADAVVTVTAGCRDTLAHLHPELRSRIELLPNGFEPSLLELRDRQSARTGVRTTLIHAGALYGDRSAAPLVRALGTAGLRARVRLELLGSIDQATREAVRAAPPELEIALHPPVDWGAAIDRMRSADVAVVINSVGTGGAMALPSKLYEALALGRPVLALTPPGSDTERLLRTLGDAAGVAAPDDEAAIAAAARRLLDDPTMPVAPELLSDYDRNTVATRVVALLNRLSDGRGRSGRA